MSNCSFKFLLLFYAPKHIASNLVCEICLSFSDIPYVCELLYLKHSPEQKLPIFKCHIYTLLMHAYGIVFTKIEVQ